MARILNSKITVYLVKNRYTEFSEVLRNESALNSVPLFDGAGVFYYAKSQPHQPGWMKRFFQDSLNAVEDFYSATANGLMLVTINCDKKDRIFAISFGHGWQFMKNRVCEERFGLKVTLNIVDPDSLRRIDKKNMTSVPKDTTEQLTKAGTAADFGIDIEQDLVRSISGSSNEGSFGNMVTGKDSLSVSAPVNMTIIDRFLKLCYEKYISSDYKTNFGWIDQISEIKDDNLVSELDTQLIKNINRKDYEKTWMAVPEIVDWSNIRGFGYSDKPSDLKDDINLGDFLNSLDTKERAKLSIDTFFEKTVFSFNNSDNIKDQWSAYECLYCEVSYNDKTYLLSNNKWYEIEKEFAAGVNSDFIEAVKESKITLPIYTHKNEPEYNKSIPTSDGNYSCMDGDLVYHGGPNGKIEFCDLISKDKKIIHVKRYGGSSVLSHLFAQGLVSGELFLRDKEFRNKLNDILPNHLKLKDTVVKPRPEDYTIIFGIISASKGDLEIPFFSKVGFRNAKRRLETFGYPVSIVKIEVSK